MTITLSNFIVDDALDPKISEEVFSRVTQTSVVAQVGGRVPMHYEGDKFLVDAGVVEAAIVEEGAAKPVDSTSFSFVQAKPLKAAVIVDWTQEMRKRNPLGVIERIQNKMLEAIQEQIDAAVLYGISVRPNTQIAGINYLNETENRVTLGTATTQEGGTRTDLFDGYDMVADAGYDFTSFIADPRARSMLASEVGTDGRPLYNADAPLGGTSASVLGLPATFGKTVSGRFGKTPTDSGVRLFGGDFANNLKFGFVDEVSIKLSDQAYVGGKSLWETNSEAALVEATFGFIIRDLNAFTAFEIAADTGA